MSDNRIEDIEERLLILRDKAAREGFRVPDEVLDFIAEKYALPQTLKGALINVTAYAMRRDIPIDMSIARLVLDGIRPGTAVVEVVAVDAQAVEKGADEFVAEAPLDEEVAEGLDVEPEETFDEPVLPLNVQPAEPHASLEDALASVLDTTVPSSVEHEPHVIPSAAPESLFAVDESSVHEAPAPAVAPVTAPAHAAPVAEVVPSWATPAPAQTVAPTPQPAPVQPGFAPPAPIPATVWFAPMRTAKKESLVTRAGRLLQRAGLAKVIGEGDLVAIKLHFGEEGNTGFVNPVFVREVVRVVREAGGSPFLTDCNTLYRGKRANAVDHLTCALHNGFSFATVEAPVIIADGLDGREAVDVPIEGFDHFDSVRLGAAAVHADALVVVTHVKGHEATGMGGAFKNVGMGLGCRSAKQRMHSDLKPQVNGDKCTACGRCVKWCPVGAIAIGPDRVARIDYELCYGCGECVAACPEGAIGIQWKTEPAALQEKIVEHAAGAIAGKDGKVIYLSFLNNISPDCDCWHFSDASIVSDIGVLASTDIVAIDQAAHDLVTKARGLAGTRGEGLAEGTDKFHEVTGVDGTLGLAYAEAHGLGRRAYELRTLD